MDRIEVIRKLVADGTITANSLVIRELLAEIARLTQELAEWKNSRDGVLSHIEQLRAANVALKKQNDFLDKIIIETQDGDFRDAYKMFKEQIAALKKKLDIILDHSITMEKGLIEIRDNHMIGEVEASICCSGCQDDFDIAKMTLQVIKATVPDRREGK